MARSIDVLEKRREVLRMVAEKKGIVKHKPTSKAAWMNRDIYSYARKLEVQP